MMDKFLVERFGDAMANAMELAMELSDGNGLDGVSFHVDYYGNTKDVDFIASYISDRQDLAKKKYAYFNEKEVEAQ